MRKKKDDKTSKKTTKKAQEKIIEDRTFGLKNKNKSSKVQKFVKSVAQAVKGVPKGGEQAQKEREYKEKVEKKKQQEKEALIASLFKSVANVNQQQPKEGRPSFHSSHRGGPQIDSLRLLQGRHLQQGSEVQVLPRSGGREAGRQGRSVHGHTGHPQGR